VKFVTRLQEMAWGPSKSAHAPSIRRAVAEDAPRALAVMREGAAWESLRAVFEDLGWTLVFAGTPAAAIARHSEDPFPVILYDRDLTGCEWRLVVPLFAKLSPPPSVILLSAKADRNLWDEVVRCGGCDVLRVPVDRDAVARAVRAACSLWRNQQNLRQPITPLRTA
jgi:DNA-binding NtrC family response regulator